MNKTIYFDEAGNTGQNLIDLDQPVHILLSHNFSQEETIIILKELRSVVKQQKELHFKRLKKYFRYQQLIKEIINHDLIREG